MAQFTYRSIKQQSGSPQPKRPAILLDQTVSLPAGGEVKRVVLGVEKYEHPHVADATLTGYIFVYEPGQVTGTPLDLFYSASWRMWFPMPGEKKEGAN